MLTRRVVLKYAASLLVVSGVSPMMVACNSSTSSESNSDLTGSASKMPGDLGKEDYQSLKNTIFHVHNDNSALVDMELVEVVDGPEDDKAEQFTIVFDCSAGSALTEGLFEVQHSEVGKFKLFLTSGENVNGHNCYYAAFSLI